MSKVYELWDAASRNLVGAHPSEAEALAFVRAYAAEHGTAYPSSWVLLWDDEDAGSAGEIAEGEVLLLRAGVAGPAREAPADRVNRRAG